MTPTTRHGGHRIQVALIALLAILVVAPEARADRDPWFGRDKGLHFGASAALAAGGYGLSSLVLEERWQRAATGAAFALAVGAGKEGYDALGNGDPSGRDFTWDVIGTAVGIGLAWSIDVLVTRNRNESRPPRTAMVRW